MARCYRAVGVGKRDVVQVAFNYGLFPGAATFNHGAELVEATLAPASVISASMQLKIMRDFRSTVLATNPSFALHLIATMEREGIEPSQIHLRAGLFGPEPVTGELREKIEAGLGVIAVNVYGVNELIEPAVASECGERSGLHLAEDHFIFEVVEPTSGEPLGHGREGELVVTTLTAECYPLIRYRTGDITSIDPAPCPCGRTSRRMAPVSGKRDSMVTVRGIGIRPEEVGEILRGASAAVSDFRLALSARDGLLERLELLVGVADGNAEEVRSGRLAERVRARLRRHLGLGAKVKIMEEGRLPAVGLKDKLIFL